MSVYRNSCDQWVLQQHLEGTEHRICTCIVIWKWLVGCLTILLINKVGKCYAHLVSIHCHTINIYCIEVDTWNLLVLWGWWTCFKFKAVFYRLEVGDSKS